MPVGAVVVNVPPHTVADALATVSPVGSVSVNATPVSGFTFAAGLVMVKVNDVVAFNAIVEGLNTFAIDGGASTAMLAEAVPPVPPSVEVTLPVVLFFTPAVVPCTFTETVHEALVARVPADRLTEPEPATAVAVPPQVLLRPFGVATTRPAGKLSVKATPVRATLVFGFVMLNVSDVVPFNGICAAPNALLIDGGEATVRFALAVLLVPPWVEVRLPVVLVARPGAAPVTVP